MKRAAIAFVSVLGLGAAFLAGWVRLPYYAVGPGPAREVAPLIRVSGHPSYESSGRLIMTTIRYTQLTPAGALFAWIDPDRRVVADEVLYPPGEPPREEDRHARLQMDQSKIDASFVVLRRLTDYPDDHAPGALVEFVQPGCPADGELLPGDVIRAVEGRSVSSSEEASRAIDAVPRSDPVTFEVATAGGAEDVELVRAPCADGRRPLIGISMIEPFPFRIEIASGDVGGSSAGLMWAVGLYDLLTPGDLTGGRTIAGTGTIDGRGHVGPIGGIADKVVAAERAGAAIFLVPRDNMSELEHMDVSQMRLVPVSSFREAIRTLKDA